MSDHMPALDQDRGPILRQLVPVLPGHIQSGNATGPHESLQPLQELRRQGKHYEARRQLEQSVDPVPPLEPLTIVDKE